MPFDLMIATAAGPLRCQLGSRGFFGFRSNRRRKHHVLLQFGRKWPDDFQTGSGENVDKEYVQFDFALGNHRDDEPVCIIWGDQDHRAPAEVLDAYCAIPPRMKNVEVHIFPGVVHGYMMRGSTKSFHPLTREVSMKPGAGDSGRSQERRCAEIAAPRLVNLSPMKKKSSLRLTSHWLSAQQKRSIN